MDWPIHSRLYRDECRYWYRVTNIKAILRYVHKLRIQDRSVVGLVIHVSDFKEIGLEGVRKVLLKKLVVSLKTSTEVLDDFAGAFRDARKRKLKGTHREISFDNKKDFDRFVRNLGVLSQILTFKPKSVYELAKIAQMDVSNLNKIILFFEEVGVIRIRKSKGSGRSVKTPIVDYDQIQCDLRVA